MHMSVKNRKEMVLMRIPSQPDRRQQITVSSTHSINAALRQRRAYLPSGDSSTLSYSLL